MATSQFTIYSSADPFGPGLMTGTTGSLVTILDACLVNGYSGKPAAGWTKPLSNISGTLACYQQASGSQFTLFINDAAPNVTSTAKEAWACGFEKITSLTGSTGGGSIFTGSYGNGSGYGQFPLPSQLLTTGHVVVRKSVTADTTLRPWIIAADTSTMYMWVQTGDNSNVLLYSHWSFGDIYSLRGSADLWRCYVYAMPAENNVPGAGNDVSDCMNMGAQRDTANSLTGQMAGHYIARTMNGTAGSQPIGRKGDVGATAQGHSALVAVVPINGVLPCPNIADNSIYMSPLWAIDYPSAGYRGRYRGIVHVCHPVANFMDGQIIQGSGDYAGKTFMIVRQSVYGSMWALETSATVETN